MLLDIRPVHTINARGNIYLEVVPEHLNLNTSSMLREIQAMRREVEEVLAAKGINYESLLSALVPSQKRREIALIFDNTAIAESWYGLRIFDHYMPLFGTSSSHSVLEGDYGTLDDGDEPLLAKAFRSAVLHTRPLTYRHSSNFFVVYINNLSDEMVSRFDAGLRPFAAYVGFADTTYGSKFKFLLSTMLSNSFIKHNRTIILGHEDDRPNTEDINLPVLPFETFGYTCRSLVSYLQGPLLTYKIERPVIDHNDVDTEMALNSVSTNPLPIGDLDIDVAEAKAAYIREHNPRAMARAGLDQISADDLRRLVASKIKASYIYRLEYLASFDVTKFNVIIEIPPRAGNLPVRLVAALEYRANDRALRLITLF
jgi:hypothetical protein